MARVQLGLIYLGSLVNQHIHKVRSPDAFATYKAQLN